MSEKICDFIPFHLDESELHELYTFNTKLVNQVFDKEPLVVVSGNRNNTAGGNTVSNAVYFYIKGIGSGYASHWTDTQLGSGGSRGFSWNPVSQTNDGKWKVSTSGNSNAVIC